MSLQFGSIFSVSDKEDTGSTDVDSMALFQGQTERIAHPGDELANLFFRRLRHVRARDARHAYGVV